MRWCWIRAKQSNRSRELKPPKGVGPRLPRPSGFRPLLERGPRKDKKRAPVNVKHKKEITKTTDYTISFVVNYIESISPPHPILRLAASRCRPRPFLVLLLPLLPLPPLPPPRRPAARGRRRPPRPPGRSHPHTGRRAWCPTAAAGVQWHEPRRSPLPLLAVVPYCVCVCARAWDESGGGAVVGRNGVCRHSPLSQQSPKPYTTYARTRPSATQRTRAAQPLSTCCLGTQTRRLTLVQYAAAPARSSSLSAASKGTLSTQSRSACGVDFGPNGSISFKSAQSI